jgi:F-type H+-transporting ATPase subunit b
MKKLLAAICVLSFLFLVSRVSSVRAQEPAAEPHSEKSHEESSAQAVFKWVNLLLLLGAVGYLLKKPASEFFATRKSEITSGLERARIAQEESARRMAEIEQRLARLSSEIAAMRTQADSESAKERENIIAETRRETERLVDQSRQEIDRIAHSIERDIKGRIADAVINRASHTLATQMTEDDQNRIVVRFLDKA